MTNTKICTKCNLEKPLDEFNNRKNTKDGKRSDCKKCFAATCLLWKNNNLEIVKENKNKWATNNKERVKINQRKWYDKNLEYKKQYDVSFRNENLLEIQKYQKDWYLNNKEHKASYDKNYKKLNRLLINEKAKLYRRTNPKRRIISNIRTRLCKLVIKKSSHTVDLIGCSPDFYIKHIENQFTESLNWDNIQIDHIIPFAYFDVENSEELKKACHWTNTQPLLISDNLSKNDSLPQDFHLRHWIDDEIGWIVVPYAG